jgi:hypothetical protein
MPDRSLVAGHPHPGEVHPHHAAHAARLHDGAIDEYLELNRGRAGAQMHERRIARGDAPSAGCWRSHAIHDGPGG